MTYRSYRLTDRDALEAIYRQRGYTFDLPDLTAPDFVCIEVAEEGGRVVSAVLARKTVEVIALVDESFRTPAWRLIVLQRLQRIGCEKLAMMGFTDLHSFVSDDVRGFARRLVRNLGWIRSSGGECFVRSCR